MAGAGDDASMAGVGDDASPLWPMTKMRQAIASRASAGLRPPKLGYAAILSTGGMNPVHRGHVQLLLQAAKRLETIGYSVVGLWLSPSHDGYLQPKAGFLGTIGLSAPFRLEVAQRAVAPEDLVDAAGWEVNYPGRWPDFPEVSEALQDELARQPEANELWPGKRPCVFYACGTDHAEKCGLTRGLRPSDGIGVVIVPRAGDSVPAERPDKLVRVASPASDAVAALSSTRVREAVEKKDLEYLSQALPPGAVEFLLRPSLEEHQRFPRDFELLGLDTTATSSPPRRRRIYISLSALLCGWDQEGEKLLEELPEDALFLFGSKRAWVFPEGEAELAESTEQNYKYVDPKYEPLRQLILTKEGRGEVFFLKPPDFQYDGTLFHGDPAAFHRASEWLQQCRDPFTDSVYSPLLLDPSWWQTKFDRSQSKFTKNVGVIIKNFENGAHDYAPLMELLYQSNNTLEIVH